MKWKTKLLGIFTLAALVALGAAACKMNDDDNADSPTHYSGTLEFCGEQVYEPNYNTGKLSQLFVKFTGNRSPVDVVVVNQGVIIKVGSGEIADGLLSFGVPELDQTSLVGIEVLVQNVFGEWYGSDGAAITINPPDVKSNLITIVTDWVFDPNYGFDVPNEWLIKEGFSGSYSSLSGEYVYYIYVDKNCTITSGKVEDETIHCKYNPFMLSLRKGWNTVCKKETYTTEERSSFSIGIKNPPLRWLLQ